MTRLEAAGRVRRTMATGLAAVMLTACAPTTLSPIGAGGRPFRPEDDERALWATADGEDQSLRKKLALYDDPALQAYLAAVAERLVPDTVRAAGGPALSFAVIRDPTLNAFALPNGRVYVHTGLLAWLGDEAQLAALLGRETTHVTHRHALRWQRHARNAPLTPSARAMAAGMGAAAAAGAGDSTGAAAIAPTASAILGLGLTLAFTASVTGYGRDLEREADAEALDRMTHAGYDPREVAALFRLLRKESADRGTIEIFSLGSDPALKERIDSTARLLARRADGVTPTVVNGRDSEDFRLRMRAVVRENARLDTRAGRFDLAQKQLDRVLALTPSDPLAYLYQGELFRLRAQRARRLDESRGFAQRALASYERSTELDPQLPEPFRQLGLLYYEQKDTDRAKEAFSRYLTLKPDAADARRVSEYILMLDGR